MKAKTPALNKLVILTVLLFLTRTLPAATVTWTGGGGDNLWRNASNWNGGAVPDSTDDVTINVPGSPVIIITGVGASARSLQCAESLSLEGVSLSLVDGASSFTAPLNIVSGSVSITGADTTANFSALTIVNYASLSASSGGKLWLTNLTTLVLTNGGLYLYAQGADSIVDLSSVTNIVGAAGYPLYLYADGGGLVDASGLRDVSAPLSVTVSGAGSVVALSGLNSVLVAPEGITHTFNAYDGGAILMPQVRSLQRVSVSVSGDGVVGFGALTNAQEVSFSASAGGKLWLTNLTTLVATNSAITLYTQGADSIIDLSNVSDIVGGAGYSLYAYAHEGGLVNLRRLRNTGGALWVESSSAGSVVDLSGLSGMLAAPEGAIHRLNANEGVILMPQVRELRRATVTVSADGVVGFGALTNVQDVSFSANAGSKLWLTNLTTLMLTNGGIYLSAQGADAIIDVSNVTNIVGAAGYPLYLYADGGGLVNASGLRAANAQVSVAVSGAGSVVDLSGLNSVLVAPEGITHTFNTYDSGVILMPQVRSLQRASVSVSGDGVVGFGVLTNAQEVSFSVSAGGKLWLTNLTTLVASNSAISLYAQGADSIIDLSNVTDIVGGASYSLYIYAYDGGLVDLRRLRNTGGALWVDCISADSVVDLSGLSGMLAAPDGTTHRLNANGGVILMPQVRELRRAIVTVSAEGTVGFGGLTNIQDVSFSANAGGKLWLTNLTTLVLTNGGIYLYAQGADAIIDVSGVTNIVGAAGHPLYLYAGGGGLVDASGLREANAALSVTVSGAGSVVDLSGLSSVLVAPEGITHSFSAQTGGSILMPQVRSLQRASVSVSGDGVVGFGVLTNAQEVSFSVSAGGKLWLTNLTTLVATNSAISLSAQGADSIIDLSNVTDIVGSAGYSLYVYAYDGGIVDLRRLRNTGGALWVQTQGDGGVVDLSGLSGMLAAPEGTTHRLYANGGAILMPQVRELRRAIVTVSAEGTVGFGGLTNIQDVSFSANAGGKLWLTNLTTLVLTNGGIYLYAQGSDAIIDVSGVTNIVGSSGTPLYVYSYDGGLVDLRGVNGISGVTFTVLSQGIGSVVNLSGLTGLTPRQAGSSLTTLTGGIIILNDTALLISNIRLDFESSPNSIIPTFANPGSDLVLYAHVWKAYLIEARDARDPNSPWTLYRRVAMTNAIQTVGSLPPPDLSFRVTELIADTPALDIQKLSGQQTRVILFGVTGQNYRLETRQTLNPATPWQSVTTVTLTNSFRIFPASPSVEPTRFYQARKL